jgi:hypothetical protein
MTKTQQKSKTHWMNDPDRPLILSREQTAQLHFRQRLHERHHIQLTKAELQELVRGITLGRAHRLTDYAQGRNLFAVAIRGKLVGVAYDHHINTLVTILPSADPRILALAKRPGRALTKWLQATKQRGVIATL